MRRLISVLEEAVPVARARRPFVLTVWFDSDEGRWKALATPAEDKPMVWESDKGVFYVSQ